MQISRNVTCQYHVLPHTAPLLPRSLVSSWDNNNNNTSGDMDHAKTPYLDKAKIIAQRTKILMLRNEINQLYERVKEEEAVLGNMRVECLVCKKVILIKDAHYQSYCFECVYCTDSPKE